MKILLIADSEEKKLWDAWGPSVSEQLSDVDLILSAGDLSPFYLEFLVTMTNLPLLYVRGNHDSYYDERLPEGCIDIDDKVLEIKGIRIAGLGGSMRYHDGKDMYTENEMAHRVRRLKRKLWLREFRNDLMSGHRERSGPDAEARRKLDILLTHAPCKGFGDMEDLPHQGFDCLNDLLETVRPRVHCYGHVHREYGKFQRVIKHPSGTDLINGSGMYIFEIQP